MGKIITLEPVTGSEYNEKDITRIITLESITKGQNVYEYSVDIVNTFYEGLLRQNGRLTKEHLNYVDGKVDDILFDQEGKRTDYKMIAKAIAQLHDLGEDFSQIYDIDVFNPYSTEARNEAALESEKGKVYLNELFDDLNNPDGKKVCYGVDRITVRPEIGKYEGYSRILIKLQEELIENEDLLSQLKRGDIDAIKILMIIDACIKVFDKDNNTDPDEERDLTSLLEKYAALKDAGPNAIRQFYSDCGVLNTFRATKDFSYNKKAFRNAVIDRWRGKKIAQAEDNIDYFLSDAEDSLYIFISENNGLFDTHKMKRLLKTLYKKSLKILENEGIDTDFYIRNVLPRMGHNRLRQRDVKTILEELIEEGVRKERQEITQ